MVSHIIFVNIFVVDNLGDSYWSESLQRFCKNPPTQFLSALAGFAILVMASC